MRILAVSDIHNNLSCVNKLRAAESNRFDVVVVAGDIGNEMAGSVLQALSTFQCRVLYVYGNWDKKLAYETGFSTSPKLLHLEPATIAGVTFAGFSGCPTHWGKNPIALQAYQEADDFHREVVAALKDAVGGAKQAARAARYTHKQRITELQKKNPNKQSVRYRECLRRLEKRLQRDIERAWQPERALHRLREFRMYQKDSEAADRRVLPLNRFAMVKRLGELHIDPARTVIVTHERLGHINEYRSDTFAHLYGHVHGFKHTVWQGTQCINVSVLDKLELLLPKSRLSRDSDLRYANAGTYTIIEIAGAGTTVESIQLAVDYTNWKREPFVLTEASLIPEEAHFGPCHGSSTETE